MPVISGAPGLLGAGRTVTCMGYYTRRDSSESGWGQKWTRTPILVGNAAQDVAGSYACPCSLEGSCARMCAVAAGAQGWGGTTACYPHTALCPAAWGSHTLGHKHMEERKEGGKCNGNGSGNPHGTGGIAQACLEMGDLSGTGNGQRTKDMASSKSLQLKEAGESFQPLSAQFISM